MRQRTSICSIMHMMAFVFVALATIMADDHRQEHDDADADASSTGNSSPRRHLEQKKPAYKMHSQLQQQCKQHLNLPVDPLSIFVEQDTVITVGNNQKVTVDDILFGYDVLFESRKMFTQTRWLGVLNMQDPSDAMKIAEYIWDAQPEAIIEMGTNNGGGALFYATIVSQYSDDVPIITMDPVHYHNFTNCAEGIVCSRPDERRVWKQHVQFIQGDPVELVNEVRIRLGKRRNVFVIEDSWHFYNTVISNIEAYYKFVPPGGVLLVQDTKIDRFNKGPGPYAAVKQFLKNHTDFYIDRSFENLLYTQHPRGWLRRRKS